MINNKTIRSSVVSKLTGVTAAGTNVYNSRVNPNQVAKLPAIMVYTTSAQAEGLDHVSPGFRKTLEIVIEAAVATSGNYADTLDDIIYGIKNALFTDNTWFSQFESVAGYTENYNYDGSGEVPIATGTLQITVEMVELQ